MKNVILASAFFVVALSTQAHAQTVAPEKPSNPEAGRSGPFSEQSAELLKQDILEGLKSTIAMNLKLSSAEAARFWPVYDAYAQSLIEVKAGQKDLIKEYSEKYGKYDDSSAALFIRRWLDVDVKVAALRVNYVSKFEKAVPGLKAASFFQIERSLTTALDLRLSTQLPLLQDQANAKAP